RPADAPRRACGDRAVGERRRRASPDYAKPAHTRSTPVAGLAGSAGAAGPGGWAGLGWAGLGWAGLGWAGLGWLQVCRQPADPWLRTCFESPAGRNLAASGLGLRRA